MIRRKSKSYEKSFKDCFKTLFGLGAVFIVMQSTQSGELFNKIEGTEIFRQTIIDSNAGSGHVAHLYNDSLFILPLGTPVHPAMITAIKRIGSGWMQADMKIILPKKAKFVCARGTHAFFIQQGNVLQIDLDGDGAVDNLGSGLAISADCSALEIPLRLETLCDNGSPVFQRLLSHRDGWLIGCPAVDGDGIVIQSISPDGKTVSFGTVAKGRGVARQWTVDYLPWSNTYLIHVSYPGAEFFGLIDSKGWRMPFQPLPKGPWFETSRGLGAGRARLNILRPSDPLIIHATTGQLFFVHNEAVSLLKTSALQVRISQDGCYALIVTDNRSKTLNSDGFPFATQIVNETHLCVF